MRMSADTTKFQNKIKYITHDSDISSITNSDGSELLFESLPPPSFRDKFLKHIEDTNRPETFCGLSWSMPPDKLEGSEIITRFKVSSNKRPKGDLVPCTLCDNRPKFLAGGLIWSPDHRVRLIGHCCAKNYGDETFREMLSEYRDKEQADQHVDFLLENLRYAQMYANEATKLESVCYNLMHYRNVFKSQLREAWGLIKKAHKGGGALKVAVAHNSEVYSEILKAEGGVNEHQFETIHTLIGDEFYANSFNFRKECNELISFFQGFELFDEDACLSAVVELESDRKKLAQIVKSYKQNKDRIYILHKRISNAIMFFSRQNLDGLRKYGAHTLSDLPFSVRIENDMVTFKLVDKDHPVSFKLGSNTTVPTILLSE